MDGYKFPGRGTRPRARGLRRALDTMDTMGTRMYDCRGSAGPKRPRLGEVFGVGRGGHLVGAAVGLGLVRPIHQPPGGLAASFLCAVGEWARWGSGPPFP